MTNVNLKRRANTERGGASPGANGGKAIPARFRGDPEVWAGWLYFREGLTQSDIADVMGISRATVNGYIAGARARGIVTVTMEPNWLSSISLSEALAARFGLKEAVVIPDRRDPDMAATRIGMAGAALLSSVLEPGDVLGVAWGRTVFSLAQHADPTPDSGLAVVQITGGTTATFDFSPELCAALLAERLNARCIHITAPARVSSPAVRDILLKEPIVGEQLAIVKGARKLVFGICNTEPDSLIYTSGVARHDRTPVHGGERASAVIAGRFMASDGAPIRDDYDETVVGLTLDEIRRADVRIAVAGGLNKVEAIRAALNGGYATVIVTDAPTAKALLGEAGQSM